jgi:multiple sugar transport system substrate-binding protein
VLRSGRRVARRERVAPDRTSAGLRSRRVLGGSAATLVLASTLAACGGGESGAATTLTWYINPDSGGQAAIAERCSEESNGAFRIETAQLPRDSPSQREQLIRRLAAEDSSIDLMSLDVVFPPEFAQAGFLAPVPEDVAQEVSEGVFQGAVDSATWDGELVAVPFWANTQLLWYRKSVAEAAGLDMTQPVTWDQLIEAAESQDVLLSAQGRRSESLMVWFNALLESAGGQYIEETGEGPEDIVFGLSTPEADRAAEVMAAVANSSAVGAGFTTASEDTSASEFESDDAGFMVNWPFVYAQAVSKVEAGTLDQSVPDDYGWALYPAVDEGTPSAPPLGGIDIGVSAFSQNPDLAYQAVTCIVQDENQAEYMVTNGNPASSIAVYDDPEVREAYPMADTIRESLELAASRPLTAYYSEVLGSFLREYHPPGSVDDQTGERTEALTKAVLTGDQLL